MVRRLTKDIVRCFIALLAILVCLQLGFFFYTSRSSLFYRDLKNVTAQITIPTPTTTPEPHKTTLITNRTCTRHYSLLILAISAPANLKRRNYIRKTWAFEWAFKPRWTTVFLVAQSRIQSESNSLLKEDEVYEDLVRANYPDHYTNLTLKVQMGLEWATRYCKFSFLLQTDDDVFVNSEKLLSLLSTSTMPKSKLFMGKHYKNPRVIRGSKFNVSKEVYGGETYPDFCPGMAYVLSYDVAILFVNSFASVPLFSFEDVYSVMLANKTGIKSKHIEGIEVDARNQCIPGEGTLVRHGFFAKDGTHGDCLIEIFNRATNIPRYTGV